MSGSIKKIASPVMKVAGDVGSIMAGKQDTSVLENMLNYYQNYDTSLADNTLKNLGETAYDLSQNLTDYISSVNASDEARKEAQNAVWNSYQSLLQPEHETQTADLNTRLLNQGLTVGSEAYQRAMNDLIQKQNLALNQAAYKAVSEGNDVFNQSFGQALENAKLNNSVRKNELDEMYKYIDKSKTEYDIQQEIFKLQQDLAAANTANEQADVQALMGMMGMFI